MVSFQDQRTGVWTPAAIKAIEDAEATQKRNNIEPTVEERLRNLEEENRNLNERIRSGTYDPIGRMERANSDDNTHAGDYLKKPVAIAIAALVFLILSIGVLIAGAITGGLGLGLYVFIPLLVVGAAGTIGMSVLLSKI